MTSKATGWICCVCAAAGLVCGAAVDAAAAADYYRAHLKDRPQGVYAWPEKGLLFVQAVVSHAAADSDDVNGLVLLAQHDALYAWLAGEAGRRRVDGALSAGLARARSLVRANLPLWEYTADWKYEIAGPVFAREEGGRRIACVVCERAAVEASMPEAFLQSAPEKTWLDGLRELMAASYCARANVPFMAQVGLLDGAEIFSTTNFDALAAVRDTPIMKAYRAVQAARADYLASSPRAAAFRAAQRTVEERPAVYDALYDVPSDLFSTNIQRSVTTNRVAALNAVTNVSEVASAGLSDVMPAGGIFLQRRVTCDEAIVTTVETQVVVRTRRILVKRRETRHLGEARFERLFLGGGRLPNAPAPRTARGRAAEAFFYAEATAADHAQALLEALRENPGDAVLWNLYGCCLRAEKDWMGALVCFRNALRLNRVYGHALTNLALVYEALDRHELAVAAALVAYGAATDDWSRTKAEGILRP